jgi:hypothetical protein
MAIPKSLELLLPWRPLSKQRAEFLSGELASEIHPTHVLHGLSANAVVARVFNAMVRDHEECQP